MISQKEFKKLEYKYGCGYWDVCWEHACPCNISVKYNGMIREDIYNSLIKEIEIDENDDYNNYNDEIQEEYL